VTAITTQATQHSANKEREAEIFRMLRRSDRIGTMKKVYHV